jgi:hypothetical protein
MPQNKPAAKPLLIFKDRVLLVASKHQKEQVLSPVLSEPLQLAEVIAADLDTDVFGTFSGEIERTLSPLEAAKAKCQAVLAQHPHQLVVASEGSFGPHPVMPYIAANEELLYWVDPIHSIEVWTKALSTHTNFGATEIYHMPALLDFANRSQFPSHALIIKDRKDGANFILKGIDHWPSLVQTASVLLKKYGRFYIETDMRACYNPSRRKVINEAAQQLLAKLNNHCHACGMPGFGLTQIRPGLPCEECKTPTRLTKSKIESCQICGYQLESLYPNGAMHANPMHCDVCNP